MPFVQRVVQPVNIAQTIPSNRPAGAGRPLKYHCSPGKCKNNNCIKKQEQDRQQQHEAASVQDIAQQTQSQHNHASTSTTAAPTTTNVTKAIIHADHTHTNGFGESFSYGTDTDDEVHSHASTGLESNTAAPIKPGVIANPNPNLNPTPAPAPPMKKLKQHIEFLSTAPSPSRTYGNDMPSVRTTQRRVPPSATPVSTPQSPTSAKIVTGYEFDSISNITLSNALRQLASLVLIASDIFDELQLELRGIGERTRKVQCKIVAVEQRVSAFDPKTVTVPESDLLTFAQRKIHYESDKVFRKELFTVETRPSSVRQLYEDAAKELPTPRFTATAALASPHSATSCGAGDSLLSDGAGIDASGAGVSVASSDELVCTPVFGKANRKMRTRIDAEIEIRLPAAIEDLRKWTSSEALGDVTVTPDCMHHVDTTISTSMIIGDNGLLTPALSPSVLSADAVDAMYSLHVSATADATQLPNDINKDVPLNHRLPSPEEQCKIIALKYPAEVISVDTSGRRFERMCLARKSTTGVFTGHMAEANNLSEDVQTVSRRSRSRKVRGKRRNTIAGIDQKEIQDAANGDATSTAAAAAAAAAPSSSSSSTSPGGEIKNSLGGADEARRGTGDKSKKFGRSKSSDILKKESVALPYDKGKSTLTRLNSLKQWGRNRFKFMQRNETAIATATGMATGTTTATATGTGMGTGTGTAAATANVSVNAFGSNAVSPGDDHSKAGVGLATGAGAGAASSAACSQAMMLEQKLPRQEGHDGGKNATSSMGRKMAAEGGSGGRSGGDIDDECVVHELVSRREKGEGRFSHERKPSYSSSEKSVSVSSSGHLRGKLHLATCGSVKLRDTSSLNRQRRNGISANGLGGGKDEQPHSSSGNWSASSESGRASIGSEITIQPKSSASNTSLNVSSFHPGSSGPPSSMLSRRRFLNTSASSSVTSEGTATPELQVTDAAYPNHLDDETSSAYSCDTEGYYTSFHMDSGLRTLKEEEPGVAMTLTLTQTNQALHTSNFSFGSQSNQTVLTLTAESEYELFGRGSTSTTTSSAGTVCTTLMASHSEQNSLSGGGGPDVPERISSLGKLSKSNHSNSNSTSTSTLERSYSSSTIGSTLERTGTIKRNTGSSAAAGMALRRAASQEGDQGGEKVEKMEKTELGRQCSVEACAESPGEELDFEQRIRRRAAQPLPSTGSMGECSESSDLEGVERIERIKQKVAITSKRIPSMCIITPTTSDDENHYRDSDFDPNRTLTRLETSPCSKAAQRAEAQLQLGGRGEKHEVAAYCSVDVSTRAQTDHNLNELKCCSSNGGNAAIVTTTTTTTNNNDPEHATDARMKVALPARKRSSPKSSASAATVVNDDALYDTAGEYVTIADISNNNNRRQQLAAPTGLAIYYSNDIVRRRHEAAQANELGALPAAVAHSSRTPHAARTEYVSLNELPLGLRRLAEGRRDGETNTRSQDDVGNNGYCDGDGGDGREGDRRADDASEQCAAAGRRAVPMYAEIGELRESALISPTTLQQKGARVRMNAQGRIIYDSDSLKRRKGAHTTFAPGPYVKETESALPIAVDSPPINCGSHNSESVASKSTSTAARLLLLNGGIAATRKVANVRPIVAQSPLSLQSRAPHSTNSNSNSNSHTNTNGMLPSRPDSAGLGEVYLDQHVNGQSYLYAPSTDKKNMLANNTNPFICAVPAALCSPTGKSNTSSASVTGSGTGSGSGSGSGSSSSTYTSVGSHSNSSCSSNSSSTNPSTNCKQTSAASVRPDEGYQRFYRASEEQPQEQMVMPNRPAMAMAMDSQAMPFQRNSSIYWTLQNRRPVKPSPSNGATSRDDLYATPIRRADRINSAQNRPGPAVNISPIGPRLRTNSSSSTSSSTGSIFLTSTPTKSNASNWENESPERLETCADRIGQSKMSLMDFKRLLLAKSAKTSPVQKKISAVELLKKNNNANANGTTSTQSQPTTAASALNSSMKLLDLSGSPKTFANRRMLRQGQFGSPSKSFVPKLKSSPAAWRANSVQHTDVMSTTIPEANSEEDQSNTSGGSNNSSKTNSLVVDGADERSIAQQRFEMKRNFFLQNEENNFMRGELKTNFAKTNTSTSAPTGIDIAANTANPDSGTAANSVGLPALETAL